MSTLYCHEPSPGVFVGPTALPHSFGNISGFQHADSATLLENHWFVFVDAEAPSVEEWETAVHGLEKSGDTVVRTWTVQNRFGTVDAFRQARMSDINRACEDALSAIKSGYPDGEVLTWDQQEREAQAYTADSGADVPLLAGIAAARGITRADLVGRVLAKTALAKSYTSTLIGKRQGLEDQLEAAETFAEVDAVTWE